MIAAARMLMLDVLGSVCGDCGGSFRAAMLHRSSSPAWGNWWRVYEVRWTYHPAGDYERRLIETGFWPSSYEEASEWAERHVAPRPFMTYCPSYEPRRLSAESELRNDLRYLASVPRVLVLCPWLPERLQAMDVLDEF